MALSVNTNVTSQTVQKNLNKAGDSLSTSMTRLSSGLKINSAKDDAAGMQMANRLTSQTKGMTVAIANANNGTSIAQTAEGAMQESTNILQRLRELALQSANGDKSDADRASLQQEFTAKTGELTRIAQTTTYGGRNILDGSFQNQAFQVGADANQTISFGMSDVSATALKGSYSEANVKGEASKLSASVVGGVSEASKFTTTGAAVFASAADQTLTLNGTDIAISKGSSITDAIAEINKQAGKTGVTASADTAGTSLKLVSNSDFTVKGDGFTTANAPATNKLEGGEIKINGNAVTIANDTLDKAAEAINTADVGATASVKDGRLVLTSNDGSSINLANGDAGNTLSTLGLASGSTQAKLNADTSVSLNGVEVKFKKGDTMDTIVSSINSASTGVTASKSADNTLALFSTKNISVADGGEGTGLDALGLTAANTSAATSETSVASLSVLTAADSQRTVQALSDAIQQIDTQRSALGAVQNRFTSTVANLQSITENSTAARSRVQDADFASEAAELTKQQTLQQASTAILSQANQLPSAVLKLLQ